MRLAGIAHEHRQDLNGHLVGNGVLTGLDNLDVDMALSFIWWYITKDADEQERSKFRTRLWIPPKVDVPIPAESPWSAESETKAFAAFRAESGL